MKDIYVRLRSLRSAGRAFLMLNRIFNRSIKFTLECLDAILRHSHDQQLVKIIHSPDNGVKHEISTHLEHGEPFVTIGRRLSFLRLYTSRRGYGEGVVPKSPLSPHASLGASNSCHAVLPPDLVTSTRTSGFPQDRKLAKVMFSVFVSCSCWLCSLSVAVKGDASAVLA